jgi:hypothetical protein
VRLARPLPGARTVLLGVCSGSSRHDSARRAVCTARQLRRAALPSIDWQRSEQNLDQAQGQSAHTTRWREHSRARRQRQVAGGRGRWRRAGRDCRAPARVGPLRCARPRPAGRRLSRGSETRSKVPFRRDNASEKTRNQLLFFHMCSSYKGRLTVVAEGQVEVARVGPQ